MSRRHYVVSYDIADDKRRTKVFNVLRDHGDHAQYSVFFCELSATEHARLKAYIVSVIKSSEDQVLFLDMGPAERDLSVRLEVIGQRYEPPSRLIVV